MAKVKIGLMNVKRMIISPFTNLKGAMPSEIVEIDEELLKRVTKVWKEFFDLQRELRELYYKK